MYLLIPLLSPAFAADLVVNGPVTLTADDSFDTVHVLPGGVLTIDAPTPVVIEAQRILVAAGGRITSSGHGYEGSLGAGNGPSGPGAGGGGGGSVGDGQPSRVGNCLADAPGGLGISPADPDAVDHGSSGGSNGASRSGAGGGAFTLRAPHIEIYGTIEADGQPATAGGGAGGGGAIVLEADRLVCRGTLSARGGDGELDGPGGGGAIYQLYDSEGLLCDADVRGGEELDCGAPWGGDGLSTSYTIDFDGDGAVADCAPGDAAVPGVETCNGLDDDCNGLVDDGVTCGTCDAVFLDGRTYQVCYDLVTHSAAAAACDALSPGAYHLVSFDDDDDLVDLSATIGTFWTGLVDQGTDDYAWVTGEASWHRSWLDAGTCGGESAPDGDGECGLATDVYGCAGVDDVDCNELHEYVCEACEPRTFFIDEDRDGYGDLSKPLVACYPEQAGKPVAPTPGDCDDADGTVHPGAYEVCDGIDNDCDGQIDPSGLSFADADYDTWGNPASPLVGDTCADVSGGRPSARDCDDGNNVRHPGVTEFCDGFAVDEDCDGLIDEDGVCGCAHLAWEGSEYQACAFPVNRATADGLCASTQMRLATVETQAESQRLADHLTSSLFQTRAWIGLDETSGAWVWDEGPALGQAFWAPNEPSGDGDHGELWAFTGEWGTWNDEPDTTPIAFLCERDCQVQLRYADLDGDGFGAGLGTYVCDGPGWSPNDADCDDTDAQIHPGARDVPGDPVDDDCSLLLACFVDDDLDGFGGTAVGYAADCTDPGYSPWSDDCDDTDASRYPGAVEVPGDDIDQDCDRRDLCYLDDDGDGFGDLLVLGDHDACEGNGFVRTGGDCDDADPAVSPGAAEVPIDGLDNDCDGFDLCYGDADGDGFGDQLQAGPVDPYAPCSAAGVSAVAGDCDDTRADVFDGAYEVPASGVDEDCDGLEACFLDDDGDGYGGPTGLSSDATCSTGGFTDIGGDCNDGDPTVAPFAIEALADGVDQDCNGLELCFRDLDGDGVTAPSNQTTPSPDLTCSAPGLDSFPGDDCDDDDPDIFPGAPELVGDSVDQNCDGLDACYLDDDLDGYGVSQLVPADDCTVAGLSLTADDCDDTDPTIHPGATEIPDGLIDQDCDNFELCPEDRDADGYLGLHIGTLGCDPLKKGTVLDCDDGDDTVFPGAPEVAIDGIDQDCDGLEACLPDEDGDDFGDDTAPTVPGNLDDPDTYCTDPGTSALPGDCDDTSVAVNPGVPEIPCDGRDDDCDPTNDCLIDTADTGAPGTVDTQSPVDTSEPTTDDTTPPTATTPTDGDGGPDPLASGSAAGKGCGCTSGAGVGGWLLGVVGLLGALSRRGARRVDAAPPGGG
jgi:hypothetical protein